MATAARDIVPAKTRKGKHGGLRNPPGGRPEWKPTIQKVETARAGVLRIETPEEAWERTKRVVQHYVAIGYPQEVISRIVDPPCEPDTLRKHFQFELDNGKFIADARMAGTIYQLGVTGRDPGSARFWMRSRAGWRDTGDPKTVTEPIQFQLIEGDDW